MKSFTKNWSPKKRRRMPLGILRVVPNYDQQSLEEFRKLWEESGMMFAHKVPIISSDEITYHPLPSPKRARFLLYIKNKTKPNELSCNR